YARRPAGERRRLAAALIDRFGLGHRVSQKPNLLSGGEQQRVAIARALINAPRVIVADEPTGALDSSNSRHVIETLRALHREGHTIVLVTHDPSIAEVADRVIKLKDGRIVADDVRRSRPAMPRPDTFRTPAARASAGLQVLKSAIAMGLTSIVRKKL